MARKTSTFELMLPVRDSATPAYRWLHEGLRTEILEGRLHAGARLPSTRDLGRQYRLSRGTVVYAFEQLKSEGYIEGSIGSGTYVSRVLPDDLLEARASIAPPAAQPTRRHRISHYGKRVRAFPVVELRRSRAFRADVPALDLFPMTLWAQLTGRRLRRASTKLLLGCDPMGYRPLREAVAHYLTTSRGVSCTAEQVLILSGVQEALDVAVRILANGGERVCMEDPGYSGASLVFEAAGLNVVRLPVDEHGIVLRRPKMRGARLVYVTPAHQFPLGVSMSLRRRLELLEWARTTNAVIFEDDYDSEYRYTGRPLPAMQGLDTTGQVLFAGSFSKVLFPSLRLGYLVVPHPLVARFSGVRSLVSRYAPVLDQAVLCDFIVEGHFGRHLRRMREVYAERLSVLQDAAGRELTGLLRLSEAQAGLEIVGWLENGVDGEAAARAAAERDVEVTPLSRYGGSRATRNGLKLGFAAADSDEIRRGVRELARALSAPRTSPRY